MDTLPVAAPPGPQYRLFNSRAVGIAAFFCCPLGGALLIAVNYARLRKTGKAVLAIILGLLATTLSVLIKLNWTTAPGSPDRLEFDAFEILFLACMWFSTWQAAKQAQGHAVEEHVARGGQLGSTGAALGIGIGTFAGLAIAAGGVLAAYQYKKVVTIATRDQVMYSGLATKSEATALGNALRSDQYFQDRGASVLLNKGIGATTVSFVVQDGVWNQPGTLSSFEVVALELAPTVGGLPIQIRLVDSKLNVEVTSTVGEVHFDGGDGVFYEGSATKDEAEALGKRLESMGFFRGKGANVFLTRHDDGTTVAFVVVGDGWKDPKRVSAFGSIVRDVAPTVGGLPIEMHLVNTQLQVEKDELVEEAAQ